MSSYGQQQFTLNYDHKYANYFDAYLKCHDLNNLLSFEEEVRLMDQAKTQEERKVIIRKHFYARADWDYILGIVRLLKKGWSEKRILAAMPGATDRMVQNLQGLGENLASEIEKRERGMAQPRG